MKRITFQLECSHTATVNLPEVPAQPNHLHLECATCHGHFAALRPITVEDVPVEDPYEVLEEQSKIVVPGAPVVVVPEPESEKELGADLTASESAAETAKPDGIDISTLDPGATASGIPGVEVVDGYLKDTPGEEKLLAEETKEAEAIPASERAPFAGA